jgi:S1-C subfamily serine protease
VLFGKRILLVIESFLLLFFKKEVLPCLPPDPARAAMDTTGGGYQDRRMKNQDWEIPQNLQPDPSDYGYDLTRALNAVVGIKSYVPSDAFTADTLGTERAGSGVVIRESGLVVTVGYLITEAETVWIACGDGRAVPGHALAVDNTSGFGLVQALGRLDLPALEIGDSDALKVGDPAVFAAGGGRHHAVETRIVGRQEFAGYWEYVLDEAFFAAPAHPFWGGGALIGADGKLVGIGSLILQQGDRKGRRLDMNMVVPIHYLTAALPDLLAYGKLRQPARPWLGMYATENDDAIVVGSLADGGPAEQAGVRVGDTIVSVSDEEIADLASLWRRVWASGAAGAGVRLRLRRDSGAVTVTVRSADRVGFLKAPKLH